MMSRRIIAIVFSLSLFSGCSADQNAEPPEVFQEQARLVPSLVPRDLMDDPEQYVGETVKLTGTVQHVCERSGKRMFLSGPEDPGKTFKVTAGRGIGEFSIDLNGSDVVVQGVVREQKVDQAFLDAWEAEISTGVKPEAAHEGHSLGEKEYESEVEESRSQLASMRKALAESGKDELLLYSLEATEYAEKM